MSGSIAAAVFGITSCAALQPTETNGPRSNLPPYPIVASDPTRLEGANLAWQQLSQKYGLPRESPADLQPLTGTIQRLPADLGTSIFLPKVGSEVTQTEEETRESLRRFIADWQSLIGTEPNQLSLIERTDESSGIKVARYEQRPFRFPLRGEFGKLVIRFQPDRRVVDITSTCIPNTDRLQATLASLTSMVSADDVPSLVKDHALTVTEASGERTFTLPATANVEAQQLVAYVLPSQNRQELELHLAWEIDVANGPIKTMYLDAVSRQILAVS